MRVVRVGSKQFQKLCDRGTSRNRRIAESVRRIVESVRLEGDRIVCTKCGRRYPIKDDIPIMLIDEAEMPGEDKK